MLVLECVPADLAAKITKTLHIPTIGIGAGNQCDGQVLVYQDMLGMFTDYVPKFVKQFAGVGETMKKAFKEYMEEIQSGAFPAEEHSYKIDDEVSRDCTFNDCNGRRSASTCACTKVEA